MKKARHFRLSGSFLLATVLISAALYGAQKVPPAQEGRIDFQRDILPVFARHCLACHGPENPQSGLRLDSAQGVLRGGVLGKVIVSGNSQASPLVRRLVGLDQPQMPLGGTPLSAEELALIRSWIDQGADLGGVSLPGDSMLQKSQHWAYIKPVRPQIPKVKNRAWPRNPIDHFILWRLENEGLSPSPEADKDVLIRRAYLDVIGLPPTLEEVDAFLADNSPDGYEKVVDRLLASPHYGERWARMWLDLARYADSHGFEKDDLRVTWKWRDWVIDAFNRDMPFTQFTIEQIAGDMLPNPSPQQLIATGFHRNTMLNQEGGVDDEEARWETLIDRVNTTATVWLGTTLGCAQCHNHKYDPFSQKDYYRFFAFFDNHEYTIFGRGQGEGWVMEPEIELPTPEQEVKSKQIRAEIAKLKEVLETQTPELEAAQFQWETQMRRAHEHWTVLRPSQVRSTGGATLTLEDNGSILAGGKNPEADTYEFRSKIDLTGITGLRLEVLNDSSLPKGGPGRDPEGNFLLTTVELEISPSANPHAIEKVTFEEAIANESERGYQAKDLVYKTTWSRGWAIDPTPFDRPLIRQVVLVPERPFGFADGTFLTVRLKHELRRSSRNIGRFRLSATTLAEPAGIIRLPARLWSVLDIPADQRSHEQNQQLSAAFRAVTPLLQPVRDRITELEKELKDLGIVTAMIMGERPGFQRPSTDFRIRGSFLNKGEKVYSGLPAVLHPLPEDQMANRLGLAHWLVSEENPLVARVRVNRVWEQIFGRGIVETSEDFGTQGASPVHPELLDWLATEFMREGWSMKKLVRLMVTSSTYRQSSRLRPELLERDPYNRILARGPRFRVEAEMVRDIALSASGLLSGKLGGPSVFPYQPEGIWDRPYSEVKWVLSEGEDRYRRGIYTFVRRTSPYPALMVFDAPSREGCTVRRSRTNTPLQALTTLNDPAFFEAARALTRKMLTEAGPDEAARAISGFRRCLARRPTGEELERILGLYHQELENYGQDTEAAAAVVGDYALQNADLAEQAAWTIVANMLLNMDETLTKE